MLDVFSIILIFIGLTIVVLLILILWFNRQLRLAGSKNLKWIVLSSLNQIEQERQGRAYLANLLQISESALPPLGSWTATASFLIVLAETIIRERPKCVVEFGAGVSTLVILRCIQLNSVGHLTSFDAEAEFARLTESRARRMGLEHSVFVSPLVSGPGYPGVWYDVNNIPSEIDLLVIDGPPAAIHPETRQGAASVFSKLASGGIILLDDAKRAGERKITDRWREAFPDISFNFIDTVKGTVIGRKGAP